jgi:DNA polymerase-3 subunit beta
VLTRLIHQSAYAASTDYTRPEQTAVYVHVVGGELRFVATNGHRLALSIHEGEYPQWEPVLVPTKVLGILQRLLPEAQESVSLTASKRYCLFNLGGTRLYTRLLDGPFPPYQQAIPSDCNKKARIAREALSSVLRRVAVFSESATHMVKFHLQTNQLTVSAQAHDVGEADETLPAEYAGPEFKIGFNASYVLELMKTMSTEQVDLSLKEPTTAAVFQPVPEGRKPDLLCLVMPLRLADEGSPEKVGAGRDGKA